MSGSRQISDFVADPRLILTGCRPLVPRRDAGPCPVCKGLIGQPRVRVVDGEPVEYRNDLDHATYCAQCDGVSPATEARCRSAKLGLAARSRLEAGEQEAAAALRKKRPLLTEAERRRLWNGYRGGILSPSLVVTNRAKLGREWLISAGQAPDWSLILDTRGKVVGRYVPEPDPELEPALACSTA